MKLFKKFAAILTAVLLIMSIIPLGIFSASAAARTVTVLDGKISVTDSAGNGTVSGGTVTITGKGSLFSTPSANNVTITNNTDTAAKITFDYTASNYASFSLGSASSSYSATLLPGGTVTMSIQGKTGWSNTTATLKLTNFTYEAITSSSNVTFDFDGSLGSVTVDGVAISAGSASEIAAAGSALVATPVSGATFCGWTDAADGRILSTAASFTLTSSSDMTVKPIFIGANSKPHFMIGGTTQQTFKYGLLSLSKGTFYTVPSGTHIFDDLNAAATASASSSGSKAIVLLNSSTLPAGNYTIPAGSTLLIPNDAANTLYTGQPEFVAGDARVAPTAYRTLKMAAGANITVNGSISVTSKHCAAAGSKPGCLNSGPYGCINMAEGSTITLNSGANLYAWGFITGSGNIYANSGSNVMEYFQFTDFRGGTKTSDLAGDETHGVFPFNQYYVQNIEAPITLSVGAVEKSYCSITMSGSTFCEDLTFIGSSDAMFQLTSGTVTKRYDGSTDRLVIEANGNFSISPIKISISSTNIDTKLFELPINSNVTIQVNSGTIQINQDAALFPGSEIIVKEGVTCTLGSGVSIYAYDADEWGPYCFGNKSVNKKFWPVVYAPGRTYNRTDADIVDAMIQIDGYIDASKGYVYTTAGGANIFSTGTGKLVTNTGTQTETYQFIQAGTVDGVSVTEEFVSIPIVPGKLKNADGSYIQTATDTYTYDGSKWVCAGHNYGEWQTVTNATCTQAGLKQKVCSVCGNVVTEEIPTVSHTYDSVVTEPTCDAQGYTTHTCTVCGDSYVDSYVDALGHSYGDWEVVTDATCTEAGSKKKVCSVCGDIVTEEIPATGHAYDAVVTEPTCTEQGYTTHTCANCGDSYVDSYVDALGHSYGDWEVVTDATCTEAGSKQKVCGTCGDVVTEEIPATGHAYDAVVTEPTCTEQGYTTYTCANCGDSYVDNYVDALGHSYESVVTEPTCDTEGYTTHTCSVCGDSYVDSTVAALGHNYESVVTEPTCTEDGYTTHTCTVCGDTYTDSYVDAGHKYGDWEVVTAAKPGVAGLKQKVCSVCGDVVTEEIPALSEISFYSASLVLQSNLAFNFKVDSALFADGAYANPYVVFNFNGVETVVDAYTVDGDKYVFTLYGITPDKMKDTVTATLYATFEGVEYTAVKEYSVAEYCYNMLDQYADNVSLRTLVVDLLNYGAESQKYSGYNADALVNADLTAQQAAWASADVTINNVFDAKYVVVDNASVTWKGAGVTLLESVALRFQFRTDSIDGLSVKIVAANKEWTIDSADFVKGSGYYYVVFDKLGANMMSEEVLITVMKDGDAVSDTAKYSIESYAYAKQDSEYLNLADLVKAMMKYGNSAKNYKG